MSIATLALLTNPTIAVTGGTAQTFAPDGTQVTRGISVSDVAVDDVTARPSCVFKNTSGMQQANGTWSKDRRSAKYILPQLMSDGTVDFAFIEINVVKSPLRTSATLASLKEKGAQLIVDSDLSNFWGMGAVV